jgi:drug/metabolite transporter (DMT)-like permease
MSAFWKGICLVLLGLFLAGLAANLVNPPAPRMNQAEPSVFQQLYGIVWGGVLVAVAWAICFRSQVEKLRLSLFALFALIAMEAVFLMAVRFADPWHIYSN